MANTKIKVCGYEFKNPIIPASGTFGFGREYSKFYPLEILGGLCTKGLTLKSKMGNITPRIAETNMGILNSVGLQNPGVESFIENDLKFLKSQNTNIIANIAGSYIEDYTEMAQILDNTNVDMIEVNISCPNVSKGGMAFGVEPKNVEKITKAVRNNTTKPLIIKLTPNVSNIADNAKAVENGGADMVSLINTVGGMSVNWKTKKPILGNNFGGLSGPCVKPMALKMVWQVFNAVNIPIIGMGGLTNFEDVLEFMLCGASLVQVGTANLSNPMACKDIISDLEKFTIENNVDLNDYIGKLELN